MREHLKQLERQAVLQSAAAAHASAEARLTALATVLRSRNRSPVTLDWDVRWAPRPALVSQPFVPPPPPFSTASLEREAAKRQSVAAFGALSVLGVLVIAYGTSAGLGWTALGSMATAYAGYRIIVTLRRRPALILALQETYEKDWARRLGSLRALHVAEQAKRDAELAGENVFREQVRTAVIRHDPEPLAAILESELSAEALPVPLTMDAEFDSTSDVSLNFSLPDLSDVPDERTSLTSTGKLSHRAMPQRERVGLYKALMTGLALRVAADAFRALPMLRTVSVVGTAERSNPATGHPEEIVALAVKVTRDALSALDLDHVDPVAAFEGLRGLLACDRKGELSPVAEEGDESVIE
jgi:hypothetical protein